MAKGKGPISQRAAAKNPKAAAARGVKLGSRGTNTKARGFGKGAGVITQGAASKLTKKAGNRSAVALPAAGGGG